MLKLLASMMPVFIVQRLTKETQLVEDGAGVEGFNGKRDLHTRVYIVGPYELWLAPHALSLAVFEGMIAFPTIRNPSPSPRPLYSIPPISGNAHTANINCHNHIHKTTLLHKDKSKDEKAGKK